MITLKDIAKEAGVSIMTVSNVLNSNFHKVSEKNKEKILGIIKRTGYTPSSTARSLVARSSKIIAIMIPDICSPNFLEHPYTGKLASSLTNNIEQAGYFIMIKTFSTPDEISYFLKTWNIDGAIFLGTFNHEIKQIENFKKIPLIFIDSYLEQPVTNIRINDVKGGYLATKHLINLGHKNIAFIGGKTDHPGISRERLNGYKKAFEEANLSINPSHIFVSRDGYPHGAKIADRIVSEFPEITGIFCSTDSLAVGVLSSLSSQGKKVPEDFSVIGFDDLPFCPFLSPPLTTIHQGIEEKAQLACTKVLEAIKSKEEAIEYTVLDVNLIVRRSTGKARETN